MDQIIWFYEEGPTILACPRCEVASTGRTDANGHDVCPKCGGEWVAFVADEHEYAVANGDLEGDDA